MKEIVMIFTFLSTLFSCIAQSNEAVVVSPDLSKIEGTWIIDLRPSRDADPYLKEFRVSPLEGKSFSGTFYDTDFEDGLFNTSWDKIYFAFATGDQNNSYYHSGFLDGDTLRGITFSPERQFTMPWTGVKAVKEKSPDEEGLGED